MDHSVNKFLSLVFTHNELILDLAYNQAYIAFSKIADKI